MIKEEAIDILQGAIKKPNTKDGYLGQAIDMAIKALEQEHSRLAQITQYRNDCEKLMQENEQLKKALKQEPVCIGKVEFDEDKLREIVKEQISLIAIQEPCKDLISRADAIDACDQSINLFEAVDRIKDLQRK